MAERANAPNGAIEDGARIGELRQIATSGGHLEAARTFADESDAAVAAALEGLPPALAVATLWELSDEKRERVLGFVSSRQREQWIRNHAYPSGSIGRLMECTCATFDPHETVASVIERLRDLVRKALITYGYVIEPDGRLTGVLIFRELLFARADQLVHEIMIPNPYSLLADSDVMDAMAKAILRHYPEYPVVDKANRLLGIVRGETLFAQHAFELSAQAGQMVGVESDERLTTPWHRSLRFRQPWLQLNLLTAFAAGAVVAIFQETIDRVVLLAAFLPVVAGQSGNTGCQALAVTLRCGTRVVDHGVGANVLDSPLNALAFLIEVLAQQPEAPPLAAGEIITTGVLTDAHPVAPGETWSTTFEGLPLAGLEVTFE